LIINLLSIEDGIFGEENSINCFENLLTSLSLMGDVCHSDIGQKMPMTEHADL
jgi:hypothetical protein